MLSFMKLKMDDINNLTRCRPAYTSDADVKNKEVCGHTPAFTYSVLLRGYFSYFYLPYKLPLCMKISEELK